MKNIRTLLVIALALTSVTWGQGAPQCKKNPPPPPVTKTTTTTLTSTSNSSANSSSSSSATGGSATSSAQGGAATASNGPQSNSQTSVTNEARQAPPAIAPEAFSTAPCRVAGSAGVSAPVGGISLGGSKRDSECNQFHQAAYFSSMGSRLAACKVLVSMKESKKAGVTLEDCMGPVPPTPVVPQVTPAPAVENVPLRAPIAPLPIMVVVQIQSPVVKTPAVRKTVAHKPMVKKVCPAVEK